MTKPQKRDVKTSKITKRSSRENHSTPSPNNLNTINEDELLSNEFQGITASQTDSHIRKETPRNVKGGDIKEVEGLDEIILVEHRKYHKLNS